MDDWELDMLRAEIWRLEQLQAAYWSTAGYRQAVNLRIRYKLTTRAHQAMERAQDGRCAICRNRRKLHVDHCHTTGRVRALLCRRCNVLVGFIETGMPKLAAAAEKYLQVWASKPI